MPSRVNDNASSRFELPALDLNFGSITDGTDIPPPPKSPAPVEKVPTPPQTPKVDAKPVTPEKPVTQHEPAVAQEQATATNGNIAGTKRPADDIPPSPTASARQGSLRRLFSRNMLNSSYAEGEQSNGNGAAAAPAVARPMSRSGSSVMTERKSKRSSGWFRRLTGDNAGKRSSLMFDEGSATAQSRPSGPPPPMIPELKELEKEDNGFGSDLFKNIK